MAVDTASYVGGFNTTIPANTDQKSEGAANFRQVKTAVKQSFPNVTGAVTVTHADLNSVTSRAPLDGASLTNATTTTTPAANDSTTKLANMSAVQSAIAAAAMSASTPTVPADAGKVWTSTGSVGGWSSLLKDGVMRWANSTDTTKLIAWDLSGITTGTTRTITAPNKSGTLAMLSDITTSPISASFSSAAQTITSSGALTIAHGLGMIPKIVVGYLTCVTADQGYSVGDVLCIPLGNQYSTVNGGSYGVSVVPDATNLNVRFGSSPVFAVNNKSTGFGGDITPANWTFSLKAFA